MLELIFKVSEPSAITHCTLRDDLSLSFSFRGKMSEENFKVIAEEIQKIFPNLTYDLDRQRIDFTNDIRGAKAIETSLRQTQELVGLFVQKNILNSQHAESFAALFDAIRKGKITYEGFRKAASRSKFAKNQMDLAKIDLTGFRYSTSSSDLTLWEYWLAAYAFSQGQTEGTAIENNIVTIWYGHIPSEKLISHWNKTMQENPGWKFHLVYDPGLLTEQQNDLVKRIAETNNYILHDANVMFGRDVYSELHTAGPYPNYARRADRDRVKALKSLGGIWIDAGDVFIIQPLPDKLRAKHGVLFNNNINMASGTPQFGTINNDIFATQKDHPMMKDYLETMQSSDKRTAYLPDSIFALRRARDETIELQGPGFLRKFLESQIHEVHSGQDDLELPLEWCIPNFYFKNDVQDVSWLNKEKILPARVYLSSQQHFDDILKRVKLEDELYGNSLFVDYLYDYMIRNYPIDEGRPAFPGELLLRKLMDTYSPKSGSIDFNQFNETNTDKYMLPVIQEVLKRHMMVADLQALLSIANELPSQGTTLFSSQLFTKLMIGMSDEIKNAAAAQLPPNNIMQRIIQQDIATFPPSAQQIIERYKSPKQTPQNFSGVNMNI